MGGEYLWPVAAQSGKYRKADIPPDTADDLKADYLARLAFLLEKCENERGLSAPKAWGQVGMFRWLFGWEEAIDEDFPGFETGTTQARKWLGEVGKDEA